jgi:hypothetical protein
MRININFLQTGGVPLTNDLMAQIMDAISTYNVLGDLAGNLTILSGCVVTGQNVSPGVVVVDGDVLYFEGGTTVSTVYVHTEEITKTFEDTTDKVLIIKKTVKFGSGTTNYNWADFVKLKTLKEIQEKVNNSVSQDDFDALVERVEVLEIKTAPIINGGIILAWRKPASEIPQFWKECTDTKGKILLHCDPNDIDFSNLGNTGGNKKITQTIDQMPKHKVRYTRTLPWASGSGGGFSGGGNQFNISDVDSPEVGGDQPMNIMNPHKIVLFIEPNFQ